jgi:choice-of-anchor B domain-containing protein
VKKLLVFLVSILALEVALAQPSKNLTLLDSIQFPGQYLSGAWHYNDTIGNEYALIGASLGIVIIDISNPTNIDTLFQLPGVTSNWHEVRVSGDYAYAVSEGFDTTGVLNGLQIIDLRFLPDSAPFKFYTGDSIIAGQLTTSHTVTTSGNYLFLNGHNITSLGRGVIILDISDPMFPSYVGAITNRYCHDSYVRNDRIYTSDIIDGMFSVYDISNPSNPVLLATQTTPGLFNHNTWLSDNGQVIFTCDEKPFTPLAAYDISNLNNITLLDTLYNKYFSSNEVHNVRVLNDFIICPSYGSQLTLVDAARPDNLIEVGNYTTGNSLCWDADPYTLSGNIIATDKNSNTFYLFDPVYKRACYLEGTVTDSITSAPVNNATVEILSAGATDLSDFSGEYKTGVADSGSYLVEFSKTGYISKQVNVNLQNGILTTLNIELVPLGTGINFVNGENVSIFPNPADEQLFVSFQNFNLKNWQIFDASGKLAGEGKANYSGSGIFQIDVSKLPKGNYTIEFFTGIERIAKNFIK